MPRSCYEVVSWCKVQLLPNVTQCLLQLSLLFFPFFPLPVQGPLCLHAEGAWTSEVSGHIVFKLDLFATPLSLLDERARLLSILFSMQTTSNTKTRPDSRLTQLEVIQLIGHKRAG